MYYILVSDKNFIMAIILFILCLVIGFFGDMYMRKNKKIGSLLNVDKKSSTTNIDESNKMNQNSTSSSINSSTISNNDDALAFSNNSQNNDEQINNLF